MLSYRPKVRPSEMIKVSCSRDAYEALLASWSEDIEYREEFKVILLNRASKILGIAKVSEGGIAGTVCDAIIIMQAAILSNATAIILAHNHPSGSTIPSQADNDLTSKIKGFCGFIDITLQDHIIVTQEGYFSFADEGQL